MCGGSVQSVVNFKTKEDVQYIVGSNVRKECKETLHFCKVKIYFIVLKLILASVPEVKKVL